MPNTYSISAELVAAKAATALQAQLPPLAKFTTAIALTGHELETPGLASVVSLAAEGAITQTGDAANYNTGDTTVAPKRVTPTLFVQSFGIGPYEYNLGARLTWLIEANMRKLAKSLWAVPSALLTAANFNTPAVTVSAGSFNVGDFATLLASVPSSQRSAVLGSDYFCKVGQTWLPPNFSSIFECSDFSASGTNVVGFCCHPAALILRWAPVRIDMPGMKVVDRASMVLPALGIDVEVGLHVNLQTRELRCAVGLYFGAAVGDGGALKLLSTG